MAWNDIEVSEPHRAALKKIAHPAYFAQRKHERDLVSSQIWDERGHPQLRDFTLAVIRELHRYSVPLKCYNIYRGEKEQNEAFNKGHSKARWGQSPHNFGLATDLIHATVGWGDNVTFPEEAWEAISVIAKEIARRQDLPVVWGGDWKFWDPAHYELRDWKQAKDRPSPEDDHDRANRIADEAKRARLP